MGVFSVTSGRESTREGRGSGPVIPTLGTNGDESQSSYWSQSQNHKSEIQVTSYHVNSRVTHVGPMIYDLYVTTDVVYQERKEKVLPF